MSCPNFIFLIAGLAGMVFARTAAADESVDFVRDIQPIFATNCYKCHDAAHHKGGMRLDSKATAFLGGDSGDASITPHDPDKSKLIQLVRGDDPNAVMPPKGARLSKGQVDLLVRWVKQGAVWPDGVDHPAASLTHWSFTRPQRPPIPGVGDKSWLRNPIDHFVLAKLQSAGLHPMPEADTYTLIRRLSLDLIGLPPAPHEIEEFVTDRSPDAYERLVDRLLANPHFGEKWARQWLDLGRYADSAGYGSDPLRFTTFRWRDWLIDALNRDEPYDQFTIEQIAGDLLPNPTQDQLIATAFNRNTMTNTEGGTDPEEYRVEAVKDRTDTTIQVWMGLTLGCAKCHSHKYDPITNREYYQVFAIFNQTEDSNRADEAPTIETPTKEQQEKIASLKDGIAKAEAKLSDPTQWAEAYGPWEKKLAEAKGANWVVLNPLSMKAASGATLSRQSDGSILVSGPRSQTDVYTISAQTDLKGITAFRIEALPDPSLPHNGPGRHDNGGFVLNNVKVELTPSQAHDVTGRYVRIELPGHEQILSLAEVQVFEGDQNVALKGKASQSSTDFDGPAELAIDGNTDGNFKVHSTTHTAKSDDPWWEVDMGHSAAIDKIVLWNRTDSALQSRLSNFRVVVLDEKREPVWETGVGPAPDPSLALDLHGPQAVELRNASETFFQLDGQWTAGKAIGPTTSANAGWAIGPKVGEAHAAAFETARDLNCSEGGTLTFTLTQSFPDAPLGRFRISATTDPRPVRLLPREVSEAVATAADHRTEIDKSTLFNYFLATAPQPRDQREQVEKLKKELSEIKPAVTAIMHELPPDKRRECRVLIKGNFLAKGPIVEPDVPAAFNPFPKDAPHNRLGLARWIINPENPLTARVEVNRMWGQLFGAGIVATAEDFGTQGQPPSNQPLLDWLAMEFEDPSDPRDHRWDVKRMIKLMVMSAAYRQSSRISPEALDKDPDNRLISRGPSKRLEAEFVRDQALALSGILVEKMYGPSVYPPQPDGLWQAAFNGERTYPTSTGDDRYRRGIYTFWRRTVPYPSMSAFDAPSREVCTIRRIQTSTPLQAFVTMNDPVYVECSQALARRIIQEGGATAQDRAKFALQLCLCRPPQDREIQRILDLYHRELQRYEKDEKAASEMASSERGALPAGVTAPDAAAWTVCANVLLNMDGVLTKR